MVPVLSEASILTSIILANRRDIWGILSLRYSLSRMIPRASGLQGPRSPLRGEGFGGIPAQRLDRLSVHQSLVTQNVITHLTLRLVVSLVSIRTGLRVAHRIRLQTPPSSIHSPQTFIPLSKPTLHQLVTAVLFPLLTYPIQSIQAPATRIFTAMLELANNLKHSSMGNILRGKCMGIQIRLGTINTRRLRISERRLVCSPGI